MQFRVRHYGHDGEKSVVEVIDPSDGAVTHSAELVDGEQITVVATTAHSPADIEFGEVEAIPEAEEESAETGASGEEAPEDGASQIGEVAEGAEAPEGGDQPKGQADDEGVEGGAGQPA